MIESRVKPGDRLVIKADTYNRILQATEGFLDGQGLGGRGSGSGLNVELLWITANATGSGNYTAKQALTYKGGFPKSCSAPGDIATWSSAATCTFVNVPEVFETSSHYLTDGTGEALALGVSLSVDADGKPVFFGVGFKVTTCE